MGNKLSLLFFIVVFGTGCSSGGDSASIGADIANVDDSEIENSEAQTGDGQNGNEVIIDENDSVDNTGLSASPNLLLIISDDQGIDASAQYSVSQDLPNTPVIDALAARGLVFDNAWATPSCTTTRGCLISGQHGVNSGVDTTPSLMDPNTLTLQRFLSTADFSESYSTAVIGKWHLAGGSIDSQLMHPNDSGVDYYAGNVAGTLGSYTDWPLTVNGVTTQSNEYHTTAVTRMAIDWISEQNNPWFMWLAYAAPHSPFHLPPDDLHTQNLSGDADDIEQNPRAYFLAANAHTQPDGTYHYHGEPNALYSSDEAVVSPVVGFAADGFPIFGSFIEENGNLREVRSSYRLKSGARPTGPDNPGGSYDGTFRDDYEFVSGLGDLDECNGMMVNGSYRYYITEAFPYVLGCYSGTPDPSFEK